MMKGKGGIRGKEGKMKKKRKVGKKREFTREKYHSGIEKDRGDTV